jgi:two-component system response regulator MprA
MLDRPARVLVVEDDQEIAQVLLRSLRMEGYEARASYDGESAIGDAHEFTPDLVILDLGLPKMDGIEVARLLRQDGDVPILMLTARDAVDARVEGLDAGADDYLVKPFERQELLARLRALLRRLEPDGPTLSFADLRLDRSAHEVHRGNRLIELSRTEFTLLELFLEHPRQVLTRATLFERVWGYDFGATSNALGVYIGYLRRKTEAGGERRLLHTVRGVGYVLRDP